MDTAYGQCFVLSEWMKLSEWTNWLITILKSVTCFWLDSAECSHIVATKSWTQFFLVRVLTQTFVFTFVVFFVLFHQQFVWAILFIMAKCVCLNKDAQMDWQIVGFGVAVVVWMAMKFENASNSKIMNRVWIHSNWWMWQCNLGETSLYTWRTRGENSEQDRTIEQSLFSHQVF